eukprot:COSAG05_NODE_4539_length_1471_cov_2.903061_1_plen_355_part_00
MIYRYRGIRANKYTLSFPRWAPVAPSALELEARLQGLGARRHTHARSPERRNSPKTSSPGREAIERRAAAVLLMRQNCDDLANAGTRATTSVAVESGTHVGTANPKLVPHRIAHREPTKAEPATAVGGNSSRSRGPALESSDADLPLLQETAEPTSRRQLAVMQGQSVQTGAASVGDAAAEEVLIPDNVRAVFVRIDRNHDGHLTRAELIHTLRNDPELQAMLNLPARVGDGQRDVFERTFQGMDTDTNREITLPELALFLRKSRERESATATDSGSDVGTLPSNTRFAQRTIQSKPIRHLAQSHTVTTSVAEECDTHVGTANPKLVPHRIAHREPTKAEPATAAVLILRIPPA